MELHDASMTIQRCALAVLAAQGYSSALPLLPVEAA
jgi:hypothetical protein